MSSNTGLDYSLNVGLEIKVMFDVKIPLKFQMQAHTINRIVTNIKKAALQENRVI